MIPLSKFSKYKYLTYLTVLLPLLVLLVTGAVPGYLTGKWQWKQPPPVTNLKLLKDIRSKGLTLPGWKTLEQVEQEIGTNKWSLQLIQQESSQKKAILLLLPQNGPMDQPEIEWTDISGWGKSRWGKWDIAQERSAEFIVKQLPNQINTQTKVEAKFFRASTNQETFAVLQWYALPNSGYSSPFRWFVADQLAQWQKNRAPWVAVSIIVPIEPLGQVETTWPLAQSIGETVQSTLMTEVFNANQ
ncbi:cyanoexosortase B system-associated protein [Nostoc sp. UHCC 0870]|uniref:cyanoexosortase B system-associated protein n=1 Tax=Nostoc sp. UHCC 0870 TaxID=2914041 RepID=UPI001EDF2220|nr:cyanoexosortase B system-associated protein [Nostoc sp. UHCC 0870]UKP00009.1 cyanoexosortase B system-associated protein [Nostoc sp. UHCC 0870]